MLVYYNFDKLKQEDFHIDQHNRSFMYGDSVFETIVLKNGEIRFLEDHFQRLRHGLDVLGIKLPKKFSIEVWKAFILELAKDNQVETNARIKLQVWRKSGGLIMPAEEDGLFLLTVSPPVSSPKLEKEYVRVFDGVRLSYTPFSGNKTGNMLPYILAGKYLKQSGMDDLVLLNHENYVTECVYSNLFWIIGDKVFTPSIACGCIAGIMRKQIIRWLGDNHIALEEGKFPVEHLARADACFTSNVSGISVINNLEGKKMNSHHHVVENLKNALA